MHDELLDGVLDGQATVVGRRLPGQLAAVAVDVGHQQPVLRCRRPTHNRQHDLSAGKVSDLLDFPALLKKLTPAISDGAFSASPAGVGVQGASPPC